MLFFSLYENYSLVARFLVAQNYEINKMRSKFFLIIKNHLYKGFTFQAHFLDLFRGGPAIHLPREK